MWVSGMFFVVVDYYLLYMYKSIKKIDQIVHNQQLYELLI